MVDPVVIPDLQESLSKRVASPEAREAFEVYFSRSSDPPFESREEAVASPVFAKIFPAAQRRLEWGRQFRRSDWVNPLRDPPA